MILLHAGSIVSFGYPILASALAFLLFVSRRSVYVAFTWWIWLFTPFVRRLVDYQTGYHPISPVMITPLLVTSIALLPLVRNPRFILRRAFIPFLLIFIVYLYALSFGAFLNGVPAALFDFANAFVPFGFALFLMDDRKNFLANRNELIFAVIFGLLIISAYGLYQFFKMPPWDAYWLASSKFGSAGSGIAEQTRLFGTLNSPGPYGTVLMMSLIFVLVAKGPLRLFAGGVGFPAFGLSLVRSDWAGWALAALFIAICAGGKTRLRLVVIGLAMVLVAYPLVTVGPVADALQKRLATFNNIQQDGSYQARQKLYQNFALTAISEPVGIGFGGNGASTKLASTVTSGIDSGVLQVPYQFGWVFGTIFTIAIGMLITKVIGAAIASRDSITIAGAGVFLVMLLENLSASTFVEVPAVVTWLGAAVALGPAMEMEQIKARLRRDAARRSFAVPGIVHEN